MNKTDLKFIYILGYAGHGKDTAKNILKDHFDGNVFYNLSFADTMKNQVADVLPDSVLEKASGETKLEKLNDLKDNHPEVETFKGFNARQLLQRLGTEFYRSESLDPNIHVRFSAKRVLDNIQSGNNKDVVYASSDTRFPNELNFLLQASQCKDDETLENFLKYYLNTCKNIDSEEKVFEHFKKVFNLYELDDLSCNLFDRMWKDVESIRKVYNVSEDYDFPIPRTELMKKEEAAEYGLVHIFRPITYPDQKLSDSFNATDLMARIKAYTQMTMPEVKGIKDNFYRYNVEFNSKNVKKYGFLRADVTHYSESALDGEKPEAFLSEPMTNPLVKENFERDLKALFEGVGKKDPVLVVEERPKMINSQKRKI